MVLEVARLVTSDFLAGGGGTTQPSIVERLRLPDEWVGASLTWLCNGGFFVQASRDGVDGAPLVYVPARPPGQISVLDILNAVRRPQSDDEVVPPPVAQVERVLQGLAAAERTELGDLTLERLASSEDVG
jgi:hypothetical protein